MTEFETPPIYPRHVICALGTWDDFTPIEQLLAAHRFGFALSRDYSAYRPNPRMRASFTVNQDRMPSTMTAQDWTAVDDHSSVAYILSPPMPADAAQEISGEALRLISALFEAGATAVQCESAGLAHGKTAWLDLAQKYIAAQTSSDEFEKGAALYHAFVQRGIDEPQSKRLYSIGMHLLGERDIELRYKEAAISDDLARDGMRWMDLLGLYVVADRPARVIKDGEGFALDKTRRRVVSLTPCTRKAPDDFQYNPYGYYCLNPQSATQKLKRLFGRG